jgi:hypothetical protein
MRVRLKKMLVFWLKASSCSGSLARSTMIGPTMTDNHDLHVEVQGDYIIITPPGTEFMVTYYKLDDPPELRTKSDWTDDPDAPITLGAFRARAWIAANDKARELGWIW